MTKLSIEEIVEGFLRAMKSSRKRYCKILHNKGDILNKNYNFLIEGTYMQPHSHCGEGRDESIACLLGNIEILEYSESGDVQKRIMLSPGMEHVVQSGNVHTYLVLSEFALTYEQMQGVYDPETWKTLANFSPDETQAESEIKKYISSVQL